MYEFLRYRVLHVMTRDPVSVAPSARLADVHALFERHDFDAVPVVDGAGRLLAIVSKLDLLKAFIFTTDAIVPPYADIMQRSIDDVMTRQPLTVDPELPLTRVVELMVNTRNKSFPVVQDGRVVGMIAREDVLGALRRAASGNEPE
jgi:CBS domain-containing protein